MLAPLTGRQARKLADVIAELHDGGMTYRQIASYTWRGASAFGRLQRYAQGDHMGGGLVAITLDLHDVLNLRRILARTAAERAVLREKALAVLGAQAQLAAAALDLLEETGK